MKRLIFVISLLLLPTLLAGCGGTPEATTAPTAGAPSPEATAVPPPAAPTPEGPQATVVDVINQVDAHPLPESEWETALADMTIYLGGEVRAQESSTARVAVEEDLVRVAPNTIFTFSQPEPDILQLHLDEGQVWIDVEGLAPGEAFQVETPAAVASVRGTRFSARVEADGTAVFSTQVDTVTVVGNGMVVTMTAGLQTTVAPGSPPDTPEPMSPEEQIGWGMAAGSGLDVVLPAVGAPSTFGFDGYFFNNYDWSPDGRYFAVTYYDVGTGMYEAIFYDVWADDMMPSPLPPNSSGVFFDPTGDGLAYQAVDGSHTQLCTAGMDGTPGSCLDGGADYGWPFWSPDGEWIAFYSNQGITSGDGLDLYKARPDGSEVTPLTSDGAGWYNIRQAWSPQGDIIAFVHTDDYMGPGDLWVIDSDGSDPQMLFEGVYGNGFDHLDWNPDGSALAVPSEDGGLYVIQVDGSDPWLVAGTEEWSCWSPTWAPTGDGWPLFFHGQPPQSDQSGLWYVPDATGEPQYFADADWGPSWSADRSRVAFGLVDGSGDVPSVEVYTFQSQPDFWP